MAAQNDRCGLEENSREALERTPSQTILPLISNCLQLDDSKAVNQSKGRQIAFWNARTRCVDIWLTNSFWSSMSW